MRIQYDPSFPIDERHLPHPEHPEDVYTAEAYDPNNPSQHQNQDWVCSIRSVEWALGSIGIPVEIATLQDAMVNAGLVNPSVGLTDGSGTLLAEWLSRTYHVKTGNHAVVSWQWLQDWAGSGPIMCGARGWYHWVGIRQKLANGNIGIANSAQGYMGVWEELSERDFNRLGTFSAVWIDEAAHPEVPPAHADDEKARLLGEISYWNSVGHDVLKPTVAELIELRDRPSTPEDVRVVLNHVIANLSPHIVE